MIYVGWHLSLTRQYIQPPPPPTAHTRAQQSQVGRHITYATFQCIRQIALQTTDESRAVVLTTSKQLARDATSVGFLKRGGRITNRRMDGHTEDHTHVHADG